MLVPGVLGYRLGYVGLVAAVLVGCEPQEVGADSDPSNVHSFPGYPKTAHTSSFELPRSLRTGSFPQRQDPLSAAFAGVQMSPGFVGSSSAPHPFDGGLWVDDVVLGVGEGLAPGDSADLAVTVYRRDGSELLGRREQALVGALVVGDGHGVPGLQLALRGMRVGGRRRVLCPGHLGFTDAALGPKREILLFTVELRGRRPAAAAFGAAGFAPLTEPSDLGDGLKTEDFLVGRGQAATAGARLIVRYSGRVSNGEIFDDKSLRGEAFAFTLGVGRVIAGWELGLVGMRAGGRRRLYVPAALAYGARQRGIITPNSALIFDIELLYVDPPTSTRGFLGPPSRL